MFHPLLSTSFLNINSELLINYTRWQYNLMWTVIF